MNRVTATFLPLESRPFMTLDFDHEDPVAQIALSMDIGFDVVDAVVRVRYRATEEQARRIDHQAVTAALYAAGAHRVFAIQPTIFRENRARVENVTEEIAPLAAVASWCDANGVEEHGPLADLTARLLQDVVA